MRVGLHEFRLNSELPLPTDHGDLVHQQNGYGRERDPSGQFIPTEEIENHTRAAGEGSYQSAPYMRRRDGGREARAMEVSESEELTESPEDDKKLDCDSYLSPTFYGHGQIVTRGDLASPLHSGGYKTFCPSILASNLTYVEW